MNTEQLLRNLGATGNLKGFRYAVHMIELAEQDPTAVTKVTKYLYPETARHFNVSPSVVERNLRTVIHICWSRGNREFFDEVAGTRLTYQPTNGMFLDMAAAFLRRQEA
ncbi:MAG: sporulation initiation factor Spo0A C-terminal domain-containing protein [Dysosmobacter sp.]|nr:sporulation initiation factor Spo0A C-terminal domain-containing protein [Dysosmobacter sp.]